MRSGLVGSAGDHLDVGRLLALVPGLEDVAPPGPEVTLAPGTSEATCLPALLAAACTDHSIIASLNICEEY